MESGRGNEGPHPLFPRGGSSTPISHRARRRDARIGGGESRARDGRRGATRATVSEQKKKQIKENPTDNGFQVSFVTALLVFILFFV